MTYRRNDEAAPTITIAGTTSRSERTLTYRVRRVRSDGVTVVYTRNGQATFDPRTGVLRGDRDNPYLRGVGLLRNAVQV